MSVRHAAAAGLGRARRHWRLALVLWLANLGLALPAALPFWLGLEAATARAPEADRLLQGFSFGLLSELLAQGDALVQLWLLLLAGLAGLALLQGALVSGGLLEVFKRPQAPLLVTLWQGAGRYFRRFLRLQLLAALEADPHVDIVPLSEALYARALQLYRERPDKEWGLTDCVSFLVMQDRGLIEALTTDEHFQQAGFRALLREESS